MDKKFLNEMIQDAENGNPIAIMLLKGLRGEVLKDIKSQLTKEDKEVLIKFEMLLNQATALVKANKENRVLISVMSELEKNWKPTLEVMNEAIKRDFEAEGL